MSAETLKRASRACQDCRKHKSRCDGARPICSRCRQKGFGCEWDTSEDKRRPYTKSLVEGLQFRIRDLEAQVAELRSGATSIPGHDGEQSTLVAPTFSRGLLASGLTQDVDGEHRYWGSLNSIGPNSRGPAGPVPETVAPDLTFLPVELSIDLHAHLVSLAFDHWLCSHRNIEQAAFVGQMNTGQRTSGYSHFLHLTILASGSRYLMEAPPAICAGDFETRGEPFARAASLMIDRELDAPRLSTVAGLITLGDFYGGVGEVGRGYILTGMALRMAADFGLCVDLLDSDPAGDMVRQARRDAFWACFIDDVTWSTVIGRQCTIQSGNIFQPLPARIPFDPEVVNGVTWEWEARLAVISSRILDSLYTIRAQRTGQAPARLVSELEVLLVTWSRDLPSVLHASPSSILRPDIFLLNLNFHLQIILLYRPFCLTFSTSLASENALKRCQQAAKSIVGMLRSFRETTGMRLAPLNTFHSFFVAGTIAVLSLTNSTRSGDGQLPSTDIPLSTRQRQLHLQDATLCITALYEAGLTWPVAVTSAKTLQGLLDEATSTKSATGGAIGSSVSGEATVSDPTAGTELPPSTFVDGGWSIDLADFSSWDQLFASSDFLSMDTDSMAQFGSSAYESFDFNS